MIIKLIIPQKYIPKEGQSTIYIKNKEEYCIVQLNGKIYAMDNLCPHQGASMGMGDIVGDEIICPLHQYRFNIKNGSCNIERFKLQKYEVEIEFDI